MRSRVAAVGVEHPVAQRALRVGPSCTLAARSAHERGACPGRPSYLAIYRHRGAHRDPARQPPACAGIGVGGCQASGAAATSSTHVRRRRRCCLIACCPPRSLPAHGQKSGGGRGDDLRLRIGPPKSLGATVEDSGRAPAIQLCLALRRELGQLPCNCRCCRSAVDSQSRISDISMHACTCST